MFSGNALPKTALSALGDGNNDGMLVVVLWFTWRLLVLGQSGADRREEDGGGDRVELIRLEALGK